MDLLLEHRYEIVSCASHLLLFVVAQRLRQSACLCGLKLDRRRPWRADYGAHLVIVSYNGYALIAGQVASRALKEQATKVSREVRGVRRIYNELEVASPSSGMTRTSDTWITTKVKSWLLGRSDTEGLRVKVVTENGVVYLMGLATREEAERIAAAAANMSGVQRVVRLFEIVDPAI